MKKRILTLIMAALLTVFMMPSAALAADGSYSVALNSTVVTAAEGTTGQDKAAAGTDYTTTLTAPEGYEIYQVEVTVGGFYSDAVFDSETGGLTVYGDDITGDIVIIPYLSQSLDNAIKNAEAVTLPYEGVYELGAENIIISEESADGKIIKVTAEQKDLINAKVYGTVDSDIDTKIYIYQVTQDSAVNQIESFDSDNIGYGETAYFSVPSDGEYYIFLAGYDEDEKGEVTISVSAEKGVENLCLDFTDEPAPVPDAEDLWSWDAGSKTLTLKDGFNITNFLDVAIVLPDGAALIVEGEANVTSFFGIYAFGSLELKLSEGAELTIRSLSERALGSYGNMTITGEAGADGSLPVINIVESETGIMVYNDSEDKKTLSITGCELNIESGYAGLEAVNAGILVKDSILSINSSGGAAIDAYSYDDVTFSCDAEIISSALRLTADAEGIYVTDGITLTDCDTYIESIGEEGLYSEIGSVAVTGGRLIIYSMEETLDAYELNLSDVSLELVNFCAEEDNIYQLIVFGDIEGFSIPGTFRLFDINGEEIYCGEWSDALLQFMDEYGYYLGVKDAEESITPAYSLYTVKEADKADVSVSGVKESYEKGNEVSFTAVGSGTDNDTPVFLNTRWTPTSWEVEGQQLSGAFEAASAAGGFSTEGLAAGTYTLRVTFTKEIYYTGEGWAAEYDPETEEDVTEAITVSFKVTEPPEEESNPPTGDSFGFSCIFMMTALSGAAACLAFIRKQRAE